MLITANTIQMILVAVGVFAVALGGLHFTFPRRFGFVDLLGGPGAQPPPFTLGPYLQPLDRKDVLGIVYVMNHCTSFVIVSIGVFDLLAFRWWGTTGGEIASVWATGFWWLRASTQLYLGRRPGDWFVIACFATLGSVQLTPTLAS